MRRTSSSPDSAGVAKFGSPVSIVASTSNSGPARTTLTSPSSEAAYSLPSAATGEALKPVLSRCW